MSRLKAALRFIYHLPRVIYYALRTIWYVEQHEDEIKRKGEQFNELVDDCDDCTGIEFCEEHQEQLMEMKDDIGQ